MTTMQLIAVGVTALYGVISLVGGVMGYVRAQSVPSLVAGGIAGALLLLCAAGVFYRPTLSLGAAIIIAVALLGRFVPKLLEHGIRLGESVGDTVALIMSIGGILVILVCALALAINAVPPSAP